MGFWNLLGLACLLDKIFGGKKRTYGSSYTPNYDPAREAELDDRYFRLSERIDDLESRLDALDPDSELYEDLEDDIELLRDELDELEEERDYLDDY